MFAGVKGFFKSAIANAVDAYFKYTTLLLHGDGTNGGQNNTFIDSSSNAFSITRNGNTTQGSFSPFSQTGWSNYFGGSGNYAVSNAAVFSNTATTFTIEGWIYMTAAALSTSNIPALIGDMQPTGTAAYWTFGTLASGALSFYWYDGSSKSATSSGTVSLNTWTHVAVSVNAGAISLYINGVQQTITGTSTLTNRTGSNSSFAIGQFSSGTASLFTGYISNLSVLSGTAKYSSTFTPSTTPLATNTANQVLLYGASNNLGDSNTATTAKTFTYTGSPSVQAFSPFAPTAAYTTSAVGGSGYFDGTGDYLVTPSITIGANAFCFECWIYPTTTQQVIAGLFFATTTNGLQLSYYGSAGSNSGLGIAQKGVAWQITSSGLPILNQWNHVAFVRSGTGTNQTSIFLNGVRVANGTVSYSYAASAYNIGYNTVDNAYFTGYMAGARLTNGSTPYDATLSTLTMPTAPANPTGSALCLNFTNGAIFDQTAKNVLETVGNAQISTSVKKWGTGSLYFDGSGDGLQLPDSPLWNFGSCDWTIEAWIYPTSYPNYATIISKRINNSAQTPFDVIILSTGKVLVESWNSGTAVQITSNGSPSLNTWTHLAIVRNGTSVKMYFNGVADSVTGSYASGASVITNTSTVTIGQDGSTANSWFAGYIDDLRVSRFARYAANFTPPAAAFPDQ